MLREFWKEEDGQTAVEYMLIIAVLVGVIFLMRNKLKSLFENVFGKLNTGMSKVVDEELKSGQ